MPTSVSRIFLPDPPSTDQRRLQQERFFGSSGRWRSAVLTPISAIYDAFPADGELSGGWWPAKEWRGVLICATPQASAILDAAAALDPELPLTFVGLAGALSTYGMGDAVEPSTVFLGQQEYPAGRLASSTYPDARAATVSCLNESRQRRDELTERYQVVDMESGWLCAARRSRARGVRVVLIVSDELDGRTFVESELTDLEETIVRAATRVADEMAGAVR